MTPKARHFHLKPKARVQREFLKLLSTINGLIGLINFLSSMERIEKQQNKEK